MKSTQEATMESDENFDLLVSGTRGREFESHRPDHLLLRISRKGWN